MEPDPLVNISEGNSSPTNKKTSDKPSVHKKRPSFSSLQIGNTSTSTASSSSMNIVFCVLCALCFVSSVYQGWRGLVLDERIDILEQELEILKKDAGTYEPQEVLIERLRRQIEEGFHRRISRNTYKVSTDAHIRKTRDAPECVCPAG